MSQLTLLKKEDGYWLSIDGLTKALINIVSGSPMVLRAMDEAVRSNDHDLNRKFAEWARANIPAGTRIEVNDFGSINVFCSGQDPMVAYVCCLEPGHKGRCYCDGKKVDFDPVNKEA